MMIAVGAVTIEDPVAVLLKANGFRKRRRTWWLAQSDTILVINLQKSEWGPNFYINLGVYLRALGTEETPPEYRCHLRTRADRLVDGPSVFVDALNLESGLSADDRRRILGEVLESSALPWLRARSSEESARHSLLAERSPTGLIMKSALEHLGIHAEYLARQRGP
jgi:Domain of unknown function (DUF4304)